MINSYINVERGCLVCLSYWVDNFKPLISYYGI